MSWDVFTQAVERLYGPNWQAAFIRDLREVLYLDVETINRWQQCYEPIPFLVVMALRSRLFRRDAADQQTPKAAVVALQPRKLATATGD